MNFRAIREQAALTQTELFVKSGVLPSTISQIENGKIRSPQYATVKQLADALGLSTDEIAQAIAESYADASPDAPEPTAAGEQHG